MTPPAPMKRAADAKATKAIGRVYSIRSWPRSSARRFRSNVILFSLHGVPDSFASASAYMIALNRERLPVLLDRLLAFPFAGQNNAEIVMRFRGVVANRRQSL